MEPLTLVTRSNAGQPGLGYQSCPELLIQTCPSDSSCVSYIIHSLISFLYPLCHLYYGFNPNFSFSAMTYLGVSIYQFLPHRHNHCENATMGHCYIWKLYMCVLSSVHLISWLTRDGRTVAAIIQENEFHGKVLSVKSQQLTHRHK